MTTTKIVVTHEGTLRKKYKAAGWLKIDAALKRLVTGNKKTPATNTGVALPPTDARANRRGVEAARPARRGARDRHHCCGTRHTGAGQSRRGKAEDVQGGHRPGVSR